MPLWLLLLTLAAVAPDAEAQPLAATPSAASEHEPAPPRPGALQWQVGARPAQVTVRAALPMAAQQALPEGALTQAQGEAWLTLGILDAKDQPGPPILGAYQRDGAWLAFRPRRGLSAGQSYRATLRLAPDDLRTAEYRVPPPADEPPPTVVRVFPSSAELPANHLKFYIHFSRPMREGPGIFQRLHLLDDQGQAVPDPWRRTELWSDDGQRLTLWIHPGRVKQGVNLREEFGPALQPGRSYRLVVGADVQDLAGRPLGTEFVKTFRTTAEVRRRPLPQQFELTSPTAGSREPLRLVFPAPMDEPLLRRMLEVRMGRPGALRGEAAEADSAPGRPLAGTIRIDKNETHWLFTPEQPWAAAPHFIQVHEHLEDLAGNTPARIFDNDLEAEPGEPAQWRLPFTPRTRDDVGTR